MANSVHMQVLEAFAARAKTLTLAGIDQRIHVVWDLTEEQLSGWRYPLLLISPLGNEEFMGGTNERDDIGYPVATLFLDRHPIEDASNLDKALLWRQTMRRAFIDQRVDVTGVYIVRYRSGPVAVTLPSTYTVLTHPLNFVAISREARG